MKNKIKASLCVIICMLITFCLCACNAEFKLNSGGTESVTDGQTLSVHYLDVGQGDSIFIELPQNKTMLIDAATAEYGEGIAEYIYEQGYEKIDYLIATHPHADHIGGMKAVVEKFEIDKVYMPKASTTTKTYKNLLQAIKDKGLKINTAKAGIIIAQSGNLKIDILAPNSDSYDELNNYSAVIKITYGDRAFLFMGDAEKLSEQEITADVKADVLKAGHHGSSSSTSEEFLARVNPTAAVISCGKDNSYGHPHKETLEALEKAGIEIYRTDTMGTIIASTDGESLEITDNNTAVNH